MVFYHIKNKGVHIWRFFSLGYYRVVVYFQNSTNITNIACIIHTDGKMD